MAVFVLMIKVEENREKVIYKFGPDRKCMGIIEYNKITDQFLILEKVNDGKISNEAYERWAAEKIAKLMYREGGVFPDRTVVKNKDIDYLIMVFLKKMKYKVWYFYRIYL